MYEVMRYRKTRFWAVYNGDELVVVAVYKRGAQAIVDLLNSLRKEITNDCPQD